MQLEVISKKPEGIAKSTPLLFIHGAWHGAWCWEHFLPYFAGRGYSAHALSLRGHGDSGGSIRFARLADYVADVRQVVSEFEQHPVLIGHSMGGMVVQKYLEAGSGHVPGAVLLAPLPFNGALPMLLRFVVQTPGAMLEIARHLSTHHLVNTPGKARKLFFSPDLPIPELETHARRLQAESLLAGLDLSLLDLPAPYRPDCPLLVLGAVHDSVSTIGEIKQTARVYGTQAEFFNIAHDMMLDVGWESVAGRIAAWLERRSL